MVALIANNWVIDLKTQLERSEDAACIWCRPFEIQTYLTKTICLLKLSHLLTTMTMQHMKL